MGSADVVPGVSGGTIALVLAIYHRLVESIRNGSTAMGRALRGDIGGMTRALGAVDWYLLIPLGVGILAAVLTLASAIEHQLVTHPVQMAGLFLGLVGGSTVVATNLLQRRDLPRMAIMLATGGAFFGLLGLVPGTDADDFSQTSTAPLWAFFASGAIAICAMILPGISGSFLLVVLGMYGPVLTAVSSRDVVSLLAFLAGTVIGLALFSQLLHWALGQHYDNVMAVLIGLMLGSLRVLWPWPDGLDSTALGPPDEAIGPTVALALFGFVVVLAMNAVAQRLEHRTNADEARELQDS